MPKLPGGLTKFQRIQAVKDVLSRWGKLNKNQIDQYVAAALGSPADVLERALYRDLDDLEKLGEVVVLRHTRDGQPIQDYDPETHRNIYCEWALPQAEREILGGKLLEDAKIVFLPPKRLNTAFHVKSQSMSEFPSLSDLNLCFTFEQKSYCISMNLEALPVNIALSRLLDAGKSMNILQAVEEGLGKRACCLMLPIPNLSKLKDKDHLGHLVIEAKEQGKIVLHDLNSKNGTSYCELSKPQGESVLAEMSQRAESTFTDGIQVSHHNVKLRLEPGASVEIKLPVLIQASRFFEVLVV